MRRRASRLLLSLPLLLALYSLDGRYWARPALKKGNITGKVVEIFPR